MNRLVACAYIVMVMMVSSASVVRDVFSDALIWRRGFVGEGLIPQESSSAFPESLKQGVPSDSSHATFVKGVHSSNGNGILMRKETVRYPYANFEQEETVAYFPQTIEEVNGGNAGYFSTLELASPFVISNTSDVGYTFFTRFRWDGTLPGAEIKDSTVTDQSYFLNAGYQWGDANNKGTGILLGVGENGVFRLGEGSLWHRLTDSNGKELCVPANQWVDCAVTVQSGQLKLYAYWDGAYGAWLKKSSKNLNSSSKNPDPASIAASRCIRLGGIRGPVINNQNYQWKVWWNSVNPTELKIFRGSIQSLVAWPRALSEYEIRQVFAYPKMDLVRIGTLNGNSKEFGGDGKADVLAGDSDSHAKMPSALTGERPSATIKFSVPTHLAGIGQILRITPPSGSSAGTATVTINGNDAGILRMLPDRATAYSLNGSYIVEGANTLKLTYASGTVEFDALALGGGIQIGLNDNASTEFQDAHEDYITHYVEHENWKHLGKTIRPSHTQEWRKKSTTVVNYSRDVAGRIDYGFRMTVRFTVGGGMSHQLGLYVNGKHLGSKVFESDKGYEDLTLKFKATDLVVGRNEFLILDETVLDPSDTNYGWVNLDYIRIEPYYRPGFFVILR